MCNYSEVIEYCAINPKGLKNRHMRPVKKNFSQKSVRQRSPTVSKRTHQTAARKMQSYVAFVFLGTHQGGLLRM